MEQRLLLATVAGTVFDDFNGNGIQDFREAGLSGWGLYWDVNANGIPDPTEPSDVTDGLGHYILTVSTGLGTTSVIIREAVPRGWRPTIPATGARGVRIPFGTRTVTGVDFGDVEMVAAPIDLVAAPRADGVHLAFTDNSTNESEFVIERRLDSDPDTAFAEVGRVSSSTTADTGARIFATDTTAVAGQTYAYRIRGSGAAGMDDPSNVVTVLAGSPGGTGVQAIYYNTEFFTGPRVTLDSPVDADEFFSIGSPDPRIDPDTFSGVFSGLLRPEFSEPYTFYTSSDDGIDLQIIDPDTGQVLLDGPPNGINILRPMPPSGFAYSTDTLGPVTLTAGKRYVIHWRMSENFGEAGYRIGWSSPNTPQEVLPTELLFPTPLAAPSDLLATARADGVHLAFTDNSTNEKYFIVERRLDSEPDSAFVSINNVLVSTVPAPTGGRYFITDNSAAIGQTYVYRVRAEDDFNASDPSGAVTIKATRQGGTGVRATYYNERFFTGSPITLDSPVDADEYFGAGSPDPRIDPDTFSGVFSGFLQPEFSEPYTFYTSSDDGIDLRLVDPDTGQVLLDGPPNGINTLRPMPVTGFSFSTDTLGPVGLQAGKRYAIQWRMSENLGQAGYRVGWSSRNTPQEVLPTDLLFPAPFAPRDVQAFSICDEERVITFNDVSTTETGVEVQRSTSPDGPFATIATLPPAAGGLQTFVDPGTAAQPIALGQPYYYRLRSTGYDSSPFTDPVKVVPTEGSTRLVLGGSAVYLPGADDDIQTPADNLLRLTDNQFFQNGSAFTTQAWNLEKAGHGAGGGAGFETRFLFRIPSHSNGPADGFTFVLQRNSPTSIGQPGSGLGYQGMPNSLAVKFDIYPNLNQTGLYADGAMNDAGVDVPFDFADGSTYQVDLSYDATTKSLAEKITNLSAPTAPPFQITYTTATTPSGAAPIDLGQLLGGHCGFVGFTGATGGLYAVQVITGFTIDGQEVPLTAVPPSPKVTGVWVSSTSWTPQFRRRMAGTGRVDPYGYAISAADQLHVLPWSNINQVSIAFNEDVQADLSDLKVGGLTLTNYPVRSFSYDADANVATWTLGRVVRGDRLTLDLNAGGPDGVKNVSEGVFLDGEWTGPVGGTTDSFPSGNGVPGGDFKFGVNVLAGDVNGHGKVDGADLLQVRRRMSIVKPAPGLYTIFFDVNGDGVINAMDLAWVRRQQSQSLPAVQAPA